LKDVYFSFLRKEILVYRQITGITSTAIAAKIYNKLLLNSTQPEIEKLLRKNQNGFQKRRSTTGKF